MRFYAPPSGRLVLQVAADLFVLVWALAWWGIGRLTDATLRAIAEPARQTAAVASDLRRQLQDAAAQAAGVPVVGDGLRRPFDGMASTLETLKAAASGQVAQIEQLATVLGWLAFLLPVALVVAQWLPRRLRFARRASATRRLLGHETGTDLLALRALATQPLAELAAVAPDPMAAWRAGDPVAIGRLADLELADAGVARPRLRAGGPATPR